MAYRPPLSPVAILLAAPFLALLAGCADGRSLQAAMQQGTSGSDRWHEPAVGVMSRSNQPIPFETEDETVYACWAAATWDLASQRSENPRN